MTILIDQRGASKNPNMIDTGKIKTNKKCLTILNSQTLTKMWGQNNV